MFLGAMSLWATPRAWMLLRACTQLQELEAAVQDLRPLDRADDATSTGVLLQSAYSNAGVLQCAARRGSPSGEAEE